jgi:hypothetical protein
MHFTIGANSYCTGIGVEEDWDTLVRFLAEERHAVRPATKWAKEHRTPWVAPFILGNLGHRQRSNVVGCGEWIGFDVDKAGWTLSRLDRLLNGARRIVYTTTQSTPEHQRWRIIMALDRPHSIEKHEAVWRWAHAEMNGDIDPSTKDVTRLLYCPASWVGADNVFASYPGEPLPVEEMVKLAPPPPLPPASRADYRCDEMVVAPDGTDIITEVMIDKAIGKQEGGRLYGLMVRAAVRFKREGWNLTAVELDNAAMQASQRISPGKARKGLLNEAQHALDYAATHVQRVTPLEKLRNRMAFQLSNFRRRI